MPEYTQKTRKIQISTPLGEDALLLQGFKGREAVSELFRFDLYLLSTNRAVSFNDIVGKSATIKILCGGRRERYINGIITSFTQGGMTANSQLAAYYATLVPWTWLLTRTSDCRIFQRRKVPDIIQEIFEKAGPSARFEKRLRGDYEPEREYCVQYRETDFNFVSRLMEEEGIFYFFKHENGSHTMVLADSPGEFKPSPYQQSVDYVSQIGQSAGRESVTSWAVMQEVRPGKFTADDFNYENPIDLAASADGKDERKYELYDYPGGFKTRAEGERIVGIRAQEQDAPLVVVNGGSTYAGIASGYKTGLKGHYRRDLNKDYMVLSVEHAADLGSSYVTGDDGSYEYSNGFSCVPDKTAYRPPRVTPEPLISGSQTAIVVGPANEEIWPDPYGCVKVQFHWDRRGKGDEDSSCWIRVAQNWAGKRWGALFLPRIGQEVIVDFLEGDPDRPIITGCVYNKDSMPPYKLPAEKTKSTIKTNSSKGADGSNFNELRFEDKKGAEQVFIQAERNQDIRVKRDLKEWIGQDSHLIVKRDKLEKVKGDKHLTVTGDKNEKVDGTVSLKTGQDLQEKVGAKYGLEAAREVHIKAGMSVVIEAGTSITLKAGGGFVVVGPSGVIISGKPVLINSGGSPGSGSGCSPHPPDPPVEADSAAPGQAGAPPKATSYSPAAMVMKQAAQNGTPFCEICQRQ